MARYFSICYDTRLKKVFYNRNFIVVSFLTSSYWQHWKSVLTETEIKKLLFSTGFLLCRVVAIVSTLLHYSFLSPFSPQLDPNSHWFFSPFNLLFYLFVVLQPLPSHCFPSRPNCPGKKMNSSLSEIAEVVSRSRSSVLLHENPMQSTGEPHKTKPKHQGFLVLSAKKHSPCI